MNVREWALPVYTILMQLAVGSLLTLWLIRSVVLRSYGLDTVDRVMRLPILATSITIVTAIAGAHFHLSQSYFSLLAVLNWRTSWLSREIIFTILFFALVAILTYLLWFREGYMRLKTGLGWLGALVGCLVIYSMSKIYMLSTQASWNTPITLHAFVLTAVLLGATAVSVLLVLDLKYSEVAHKPETAARRQIIYQTFVWLAMAACITAIAILILNLRLIDTLRLGNASSQTSFLLLLGLYQPLFALRYIALFTGVSWLGLTAIYLRRRKTKFKFTTFVYLACLFILIAEIMGRFLFYAIHVRSGL